MKKIKEKKSEELENIDENRDGEKIIERLNYQYRKNILNQIRSFCATVIGGCSLTKASEKINIEKSAVSRLVSSLESDLGVKLFDRKEHNKLKLTKEGELFYKDAVNCFNSVGSLFENYNEKLKEYNDNNLNIAIHHTAAAYIFPTIFKKNVDFKRI